ncbi:hypothetical protein [Streptomyces sp. NPDC059863]|uniref:hypothetical protein n=1 Tax=unclassified Streptomyces TaxID=2593676 RepID=UPI0036630FE3
MITMSSPISAMTSYWREKQSWTNDGSRSGESLSGFSASAERSSGRRTDGGLFLPPLHDDDADSDVSPSEKLKAALAESKKRRQQRP